MTKSELIKIQKLLGVTQDGIVGKQTSHALKLFKKQVRMKSINIIFNEKH